MTNTACVICERPTGAYLCSRRSQGDPGCTQILEQAIAEMPAFLRELEIAASRQSKVYRRSGSGDTGEDDVWEAEQRAIPAHLRSLHPGLAMRSVNAPVDLGAADLRIDTLDELARMAGLLGALEVSSSTVVGWLLAHLDDIRVSVDAAEIFDRVTWCRRQIERAVDRAPSKVYVGPCHATVTDVVTEVRDGTVYVLPPRSAKCELSIYTTAPVFNRHWLARKAAAGQDVTVTCDGWTPRSGLGQGCGAVHTMTERHDWLLAELQDELLPIDEWRTTLPGLMPWLTWPHRTTWWRWARRLENRGSETSPRYRGRDVVKIASDEQARIIANRNKNRRTA